MKMKTIDELHKALDLIDARFTSDKEMASLKAGIATFEGDGADELRARLAKATTAMAEAPAVVEDVLAPIDILAGKKALRAELLARIANCKDGDTLTTVLVPELHKATLSGEHILLRADIAASVQLRAKELTGRKPTKAEMELLFPKAAFKKSATLTNLPLTEFGVTERLRQAEGHELRHVLETGHWYSYEEGRWVQSPSNVQVIQRARTLVKTLRSQAEALVDPEEMDEALKAVAACERQAFVSAVVAGLAGEPGIATSVMDLDMHPELLAAPNGHIDLYSGALLPHSPSMHLTMVTGCDYVPGAKCPSFLQTLSDVFRGRQEIVDCLQRIVGYSLMANPRERVLVVPLGKGKNGKSTVFNAIQAALGDHAATMDSSAIAAPANALTSTNAGGPAEHLLRLRGKRAIFASEVKRGAVMNDEVVKTLASGGDTIVARGVFGKNSIEFKPTGIVFMPANVLPQIRDDDEAVWDRLLLLNFGVKFGAPGNPGIDIDLPAKLAAEFEGILAWAVEGAIIYQVEGLNIPQSLLELKAAQREGSSPISVFIEEYCELGDGFSETTRALFTAWRQSAFEQGETRLAQSEVSFGRYLAAVPGMSKARVKVKGVQFRGYRGLRLRKRAQTDGEPAQQVFDGLDAV